MRAPICVRLAEAIGACAVNVALVAAVIGEKEPLALLYTSADAI